MEPAQGPDCRRACVARPDVFTSVLQAKRDCQSETDGSGSPASAIKVWARALAWGL